MAGGVLAIDYRGDGLNSGRSSELGLYQDVSDAVGALEERVDRGAAPVVYWEAVAGPFVAIRDGDHNDLVPSGPDRYWGAVRDFVDGLGAGR